MSSQAGVRLGRQQQLAAAMAGGPVRVVAGAGTGKTAVIAERYRRLVACGVSPDRVLVMTFTERAAREMRQRIEELIHAPAPGVGTFHSVALGWLREDGRTIGVQPGFRILAGAERWIFARELMWKIGDGALVGDERPDDLVSPVLQMLERMKQELVPIDRIERWAASSDEAERADLMRRAPHDRASTEPDLARIGPQKPRDQHERRRLACPVRTDHGDDLAFADGEAQLLHRLQTAETLRESLHLQERRHPQLVGRPAMSRRRYG